MDTQMRQLTDFAEEARRYCNWALGEDETQMNDHSALRRLSMLFAAALNLPSCWAGDFSDELTDIQASSHMINLIRTRVIALSFQNYWIMEDTSKEHPEGPWQCGIVCDIEEIFEGIWPGLVLFESGDYTNARWEWDFGFRYHWCDHASRAMHALTSHLFDNGSM